MIARIRLLIVGALLAVNAFVRTNRDRFVAYVVSRVPVSVDRTIAGLETIVAKLTRAETQQMDVAAREAAIQEASYDREDAAIGAAQRAARVRARVEALVA